MGLSELNERSHGSGIKTCEDASVLGIAVGDVESSVRTMPASADEYVRRCRCCRVESHAEA